MHSNRSSSGSSVPPNMSWIAYTRESDRATTEISARCRTHFEIIRAKARHTTTTTAKKENIKPGPADKIHTRYTYEYLTRDKNRKKKKKRHKDTKAQRASMMMTVQVSRRLSETFIDHVRVSQGNCQDVPYNSFAGSPASDDSPIKIF